MSWLEAEDRASLLLDDGTELTAWSEYSIDSDFLTPCDGWSFTWSDVKSLETIRASIVPDKRVRVLVGGIPQVTGWIDRVLIRSAVSGTVVEVQGRDILRPLVKSNAHPDFRIKGRTVAELIEKVVDAYYPSGEIPTVFYDNDANRKVLSSGADGKSKPRGGQKKLIEYCQAHPNEGAFEFLARNLKRHGLWLWSTGDGNLVVSGPTYEGEPAAIIERKYGSSTIVATHAEYTWDRTQCVKFVVVRGKSSKKEFNKSPNIGYVEDKNATNPDLFEPMYLAHDQAETVEQAHQFALQEMSRLKVNEKVYHVTCVGHRNPLTGKLYTVDTLVRVDDEICGVADTLWCRQRTFKRSFASGTTTDLILVPKHSVVFSDADSP